MGKIEEFKNHLKNQFLSSYKSSELYHEMNSVINELMGYLVDLLNDKKEIELFFKYLPLIISEIPHESEETPLGHVHYYSVSTLEMSAKHAVSISDFLNPFIEERSKTSDTPGYFYEYYPQKDNQPSHSGEGAKYMAVFAYKGIDELKKLCCKTGINYDKLKKESCFHTEINNIPVFVSYSSDEFSKKGNLELHIIDPDEPYMITEKSRNMANSVDSFLKIVFAKK